jgi:hypothetical protein
MPHRHAMELKHLNNAKFPTNVLSGISDMDSHTQCSQMLIVLARPVVK